VAAKPFRLFRVFNMTAAVARRSLTFSSFRCFGCRPERQPDGYYHQHRARPPRARLHHQLLLPTLRHRVDCSLARRIMRGKGDKPLSEIRIEHACGSMVEILRIPPYGKQMP
jgi:hypothetical protein